MKYYAIPSNNSSVTEKHVVEDHILFTNPLVGKGLRDLKFKDFPLEHFSDAGRVANEGDPHLKAAADTELYDLEKYKLT